MLGRLNATCICKVSHRIAEGSQELMVSVTAKLKSLAVKSPPGMTESHPVLPFLQLIHLGDIVIHMVEVYYYSTIVRALF
jgi:hypothetical protein